MPLKICHLNTERTWRGGEQQLLYLAAGLRAQGHANLIAARQGSALAERAEEQGFEVFPLTPWSEWDPRAALRLRRFLVQGRCDLLHAHTAHAAALGALATWGTPIPLIAARRVDFHISRNPLTFWKYHRAARILTVSSAIRAVLLQDGLPADRIAVVHSGIDLARLERDSDPGLREDFGLPAQGPLVGQVAALAPHKDPLNFIRAIAVLARSRPDVHGVMVGSGPLEAAVRAEVDRLGLSKTVLLMGFRTDAHRVLRHFDVFALSSCLEGLGTSILDAMALGVPVVATKTGGIPEAVRHGVSGLLVPPKDPEALAGAMARVLKDGALRERLVREGYRTAERFSARSMVEETRLAYEEVLFQRASLAYV